MYVYIYIYIYSFPGPCHLDTLNMFHWEIYFFIAIKIWKRYNIDGLVYERRNSVAIAMELRLSCTNPSIWKSAPCYEFIDGTYGMNLEVVTM